MCIKRSLPMRAAGRAMFDFIHNTINGFYFGPVTNKNAVEAARSLLGKWDQEESKFHNTLMEQSKRKKRKRDNIRKQKARGVRQ